MGRQIKYNKEVKMDMVRRYLDGESIRKIANEYGLTPKQDDQIRKWTNKYLALGDSAFDYKSRNKSYSKEIKIAAIKDYLDGGGSLETIVNRYGILKNETLRQWILKYNSHIEIKDYDPKPEVYMVKPRKTTKEERIEIVNYCLSNGKNYKAAAIKYGVNYAQVFAWTKKYLEFGAEGLEDKRGRKKPESELSEVEKLKLAVKKLEARNKYLEMESEVLKKLKKMEREVVNGSYKKRNTK